MLAEENIQIGQFVSHHTWGAGRIADFEDEGGWVRIDFESEPGRSIARDRAIKVLDQLPEDGLRAMLLVNPDTARRWQDEAPLRLVAAALMDSGGKAKTQDIKSRIVGRVIDSDTWARWWERVRNALKESDQFAYRKRTIILKAAKPGDVQPISLAEIVVPSRKAQTNGRAAHTNGRVAQSKTQDSQPKAKQDPADRLAEWVKWILSDEVDSVPGQYPTKALFDILRNLHESITAIAINNLTFGIEQRVIASKKPSASSTQAWLDALVAVLRRWLDSPNAPSEIPLDGSGIPLHRIVTIAAHALDIPDLKRPSDLVDWLSDYASKSDSNIYNVAKALSQASQNAPDDGVARVLNEMRNSLDPATRVDLWLRLVLLNTDEESVPRVAQWLRILNPAEKAEILSSLLLSVKDEKSIRAAGSLMQKEWALANQSERHHLFKVALLAWLSHEQLRSECRAILEAVVDQGQEYQVPADSHVAEWKAMAESLAQGEVAQVRTAKDKEIAAVHDKLEEREEALDGTEKMARFLGGELQKATQVAELDVSRDAILVLGETLQRLVGPSDSSPQKVRDANAGITLALMALGTETFGEIGEEAPFDPSIHEVRQPPVSGAPIRIVAPGLRYTKRTNPPLVLIRMKALTRE